MLDNRGFTLLEVLVYAVITGSILLVLLTTIGFGKEAISELAKESEQSYSLRTISSYLYREVRLMDKNRPIIIQNNGSKGNKITYQQLGLEEIRTIEIAPSAHRLYCRVRNGAVLILAENISYIQFTLEGEIMKVKFILAGKEYELVIPWD